MKYLRTFYLAIQTELVSLANIAGWFVVGSIPSVALVLVWLSILGDHPSISGFTKGDFIVYYLFMTFSWYIVGGNFIFKIGNAIRDGEINATLLQPYNVILGKCIKEQAWKVLSILVSLPPALLILYAFRDIIRISMTPAQGVLLFVSLVLGAVIFAFLEALSGIMAFWVTEIWPVAYLGDILRSLFGGRLIPLPLMPAPVLLAANFLPFKYTFYVPVSILLSRSSTMYRDVGIQLAYTGILYVLFTWAWHRGLKKYEAVGS